MGNFSNYWDLHTLFTKIKNKIKSVSDKIDDSVSLKTATGNPVTITDAANANAEELSMTIEPIQSGSGDPSPTNVRPISGLTEGKVIRTGKNLLDLSSKSTATTLGITFTVNKNSDGAVTSINVNGTSEGTVDFTCYIATLKAGTQYILNGGVAGSAGDYKLQVIYGDDNANAATSMGGDANFTVIPDVPYRMRIRVYSGKTVNNLTFYPMIRLATETDSTFEPYTGATATISFGQTVYGGSVNFKTGEVTVTHGMVDLGDLEWTKYSQSSRVGTFHTVSITNIKTVLNTSIDVPNVISDIYTYRPTSALDQLPDFCMRFDAPNFNRLAFKNTNYTDAATFKTAMSGVQLCYELATPTTLTLTPAELELLKGNNTITANGAEISLSYYPDNAIGALAERVDDKADVANATTNGAVGLVNASDGSIHYFGGGASGSSLYVSTSNNYPVIRAQASSSTYSTFGTTGFFHTASNKSIDVDASGISGSGNGSDNFNLTREKLSYLNNITSDVQTQINNKVRKIAAQNYPYTCTSTNFEYTGTSVTCPNYHTYIVRAQARYGNAEPTGIAASSSNSEIHRYQVYAADESASYITFMLAGGETAYIWGMWATANKTNSVVINIIDITD